MFILIKMSLKNEHGVDITGAVLREAQSIEALKSKVMQEINFQCKGYLDVIYGNERIELSNTNEMMSHLTFHEVPEETVPFLEKTMTAKDNGEKHWTLGTTPRFLLL